MVAEGEIPLTVVDSDIAKLNHTFRNHSLYSTFAFAKAIAFKSLYALWNHNGVEAITFHKCEFANTLQCRREGDVFKSNARCKTVVRNGVEF